MTTTDQSLGRATYSPEDNKLRLYPDSRLSAEDYARAKSHGFKWAPKQEVFVAPMWTPDRADLLLEWCGDIEDEDTSLAERAEERAERFSGYRENRAADAASARAAVAAIADGIPFGQPILVGHHSERHARRDAERIENGMRRAVKMWDTAEYWKHRAAGAIRHAKYKELPTVRARRIKTIEADERKMQRNRAENESCLKFWNGGFKLRNRETGEVRPLEITEENRECICRTIGNDCRLGYLPTCKNDHGSHWHAWDVLRPDGERYKACPSMTVAEVQAAALAHYPRVIAWCDRWLTHYGNRLAYERAMLADGGGIATDRKGPEKGGAVKCWASVRGCWSYIQKVNKVSVTVLDNWGNGGANFTRTIPFDKCSSIMSAGEVQAARAEGRLVETQCKTGFGLCADGTATRATATKAELHDVKHQGHLAATADHEQETAKAADFAAIRETLKAGVQVVTAANLFPTPPDVAKRLVSLADIEPGHAVLEPSAGTGALLGALGGRMFGHNPESGRVVAVEVNSKLADRLATEFPLTSVRCADFLQCNGDIGNFDRIVMNPPFDHGSDIAHIKHAIAHLNPGGRLVAICANGPKQQAELQPLADYWEELPSGTFAGTQVRAVMFTYNNPTS